MLNDKQEINELKTEENHLFSAAKDAEQIIDAIFSELDNILDTRDYNNVNYQENVKVNNAVLEEDNTPLPLEAELLSEITPKKEEIIQIQEKYFDSTAFAEQEVLQENQGLIKHFDKLLFVGSFSFLVGVIWWLISIEKIKFPIFVNQTQDLVAVKNIITSQDQEFANYLLKSLTIIDKETPLIAATPSTIDNQKLENKTSPNNDSVKTNSPTRIIERIYIPFSQPTPPPTTSTPTPPAIQQRNTPTPPPIEVRQTTTPTEVRKTPTLPPPIQVKTPPPPPLIQPTNTPPPLVETQKEPVTGVANAIADRHTVVGLLELGDRSAALFEVNGVTRRIYVGENIEASGWNLQAIENDQVVVNRNGQVRSLSVGQQF